MSVYIIASAALSTSMRSRTSGRFEEQRLRPIGSSHSNFGAEVRERCSREKIAAVIWAFERAEPEQPTWPFGIPSRRPRCTGRVGAEDHRSTHELLVPTSPLPGGDVTRQLRDGGIEHARAVGHRVRRGVAGPKERREGLVGRVGRAGGLGDAGRAVAPPTRAQLVASAVWSRSLHRTSRSSKRSVTASSTQECSVLDSGCAW